jgi:hypothetical protein
MKWLMNKIISRLKSEYVDIWHSESPSEQFKNAFTVFESELTRGLHDRLSKLRRNRQAWTENPRNQNLANPSANRLKFYDELLESITDDFLNNLKTIVLAHCDEITPEATAQIQQRLHLILSGQMQQAKRSESSYVASIGRTEHLKSFILPVENKFSNAISSYRQLVDSVIRQFNHDKHTQKLEYNKQRQLEIIRSFGKWFPISAAATYLIRWILAHLSF